MVERLHQRLAPRRRQLGVRVPQQLPQLLHHVLLGQRREEELVEDDGAEVLGGQLVTHADQQRHLQSRQTGQDRMVRY